MWIKHLSKTLRILNIFSFLRSSGTLTSSFILKNFSPLRAPVELRQWGGHRIWESSGKRGRRADAREGCADGFVTVKVRSGALCQQNRWHRPKFRTQARVHPGMAQCVLTPSTLSTQGCKGASRTRQLSAWFLVLTWLWAGFVAGGQVHLSKPLYSSMYKWDNSKTKLSSKTGGVNSRIPSSGYMVNGM